MINLYWLIDNEHSNCIGLGFRVGNMFLKVSNYGFMPYNICNDEVTISDLKARMTPLKNRTKILPNQLELIQRFENNIKNSVIEKLLNE